MLEPLPRWIYALAASMGLAAAAACGPTSSSDAPADAGITPHRDAAWSLPEAAPEDDDDGGPQTPLERGAYLVKHVAACPECHTPRLNSGALDESMWLAGEEGFTDVDMLDDTVGLIHSRNLTPDPMTGLGMWTDAEIKSAFLDGYTRSGAPLSPVMPYWVFHNMSAADADDIVLYLRSVPAIDHAIPARQPLPAPLTHAAPYVPAEAIPDTTLAKDDPNYARAQNGKYLAGNIGLCIYCHTPTAPAGSTAPADMTKILQGQRGLFPVMLGLPVTPVVTPYIYSKNLTPDVNGIQGWKPEDVANTLRNGVDIHAQTLCPPMPAGPGTAFGGMRQSDAVDIGYYLTSLAPKDNGPRPDCCSQCHRNAF